jgi:hypothetical protein
MEPKWQINWRGFYFASFMVSGVLKRNFVIIFARNNFMHKFSSCGRSCFPFKVDKLLAGRLSAAHNKLLFLIFKIRRFLIKKLDRRNMVRKKSH